MSLQNNTHGWRYACPVCSRRSIFSIEGKMRETVPAEWWGVSHYRCTNGHRFLTPVDMLVVS